MTQFTLFPAPSFSTEESGLGSDAPLTKRTHRVPVDNGQADCGNFLAAKRIYQKRSISWTHEMFLHQWDKTKLSLVFWWENWSYRSRKRPTCVWAFRVSETICQLSRRLETKSRVSSVWHFLSHLSFIACASRQINRIIWIQTNQSGTISLAWLQSHSYDWKSTRRLAKTSWSCSRSNISVSPQTIGCNMCWCFMDSFGCWCVCVVGGARRPIWYF